MARQLRVDYPGAAHHITSRGHLRMVIFRDDRDRRKFFQLLAVVSERYRLKILACVLMSNHYHLAAVSEEGKLSAAMQWLNARYGEYFNARYGRINAVFGDRYRSIVIEKGDYLKEVLRYVVLNPVRAKMVDRPEDHPWSSYCATVGLCPAPKWLALDLIKPYFGTEETWRENYIAYVGEKIVREEPLWTKVKRQIYLGSDEWIASLRPIVESKMRSDVHPRVQREIGRPSMLDIIAAIARALEMKMSAIRNGHGGIARMIAAWIGWNEGLLQLRTIAASLRLRSAGRVRDLVRECEEKLRGDPEFGQLVASALAKL
jgi:putative transposase